MTGTLHVTEDHSFANTGITQAVNSLTEGLLRKIPQTILCTNEEAVVVPEGVSVHNLHIQGLSRVWRFPLGQHSLVRHLVSQANIIHIHGLWMWAQWAAARNSQALLTPAVLSPHGMLAPWMWRRQSWIHRLKKHIYWSFFASPAFRRVEVVHAITRQEADQAVKVFPGKRVEVIPHGLDVSKVEKYFVNNKNKNVGERPYILFVGRIHPVKAVDLLIEAFSQIANKDFVLKIIGPVDPHERGYLDALHRLIDSHDLAERVQFLGVVRGPEKWHFLQNAWVVCQPSYSEVIGMVNLEAAASGTPVITTLESGVIQSWEKFGGLLIKPDLPSLVARLSEAIAWSEAERRDRGERLHKLVVDQYSWEVVLPRWHSLYSELV